MHYSSFCRTAGIPCKEVTGKVKAARYQPGNVSFPTKTYNAVFVDGAWRFVDQHWGSSFITVGADKEWELIADGGAGQTSGGQTGTYQHCDDDWFLTDPEIMICTHLPDDPAWQLLARPITSDEFEQMAYLQHYYFDIGLHSPSQPKCVIYTDTGDVMLEFGQPKDAETTFKYALYKSALDKTRYRLKGAQLKQFVFMDEAKKENKLRVRIEFPWIGKYMINLHGSELGRGFTSEVCVYVIHCQKPKFTCKPHPLADRDLWGAGGEANAIGLEPVNHDGGLIVAEDGQAEMVFKMKLADYLQFQYRLESEDIDQSILRNYVLHYVIDGEAYFLAKLPKYGKYVFKLFAKDTRRHTEFHHVSNYLITSDTGCADQRQFPKSESGKVGLMEHTSSIRITPISHRHPLVTCPNTGEVEFSMSTDREAEISSYLKCEDNGDVEDLSDHTFIEQDGKQFTLNVNFPKVGMYLLTIFARPLGSSSEAATAFIYVINVKRPKWQCTVFPKPLEWNNSFRLIEPRSAYVLPDKKVHFALIAPGATRIFLDESQETPLACTGQDRWEGDITPRAGGKELAVFGVFSGNEKRLLAYKVRLRSMFLGARETSIVCHYIRSSQTNQPLITPVYFFFSASLSLRQKRIEILTVAQNALYYYDSG